MKIYEYLYFIPIIGIIIMCKKYDIIYDDEKIIFYVIFWYALLFVVLCYIIKYPDPLIEHCNCKCCK